MNMHFKIQMPIRAEFVRIAVTAQQQRMSASRLDALRTFIASSAKGLIDIWTVTYARP